MSAPLTIDPEFRDLIPPLTEEEYYNLEGSVIADGLLSPLVIWKGTDILVDGHNRYKICTQFNKPYTTKEISFSDREVAKRFIILNQLGRRNVSPESASKLRAEFAESISKGQGGNHGNQHTVPKRQNDALTKPEKTASQVANATGVSTKTVERDVQLMKALDVLGIPRNDYASGKVLDDNGKKRSKTSILNEAYPPKPKQEKPMAIPPIKKEPVAIALKPTAQSDIYDDVSIPPKKPSGPPPQGLINHIQYQRGIDAVRCLPYTGVDAIDFKGDLTAMGKLSHQAAITAFKTYFTTQEKRQPDLEYLLFACELMEKRLCKLEGKIP